MFGKKTTKVHSCYQFTSAVRICASISWRVAYASITPGIVDARGFCIVVTLVDR